MQPSRYSCNFVYVPIRSVQVPLINERFVLKVLRSYTSDQSLFRPVALTWPSPLRSFTSRYTFLYVPCWPPKKENWSTPVLQSSLKEKELLALSLVDSDSSEDLPVGFIPCLILFIFSRSLACCRFCVTNLLTALSWRWARQPSLNAPCVSSRRLKVSCLGGCFSGMVLR
jgi:hypothetical protein